MRSILSYINKAQVKTHPFPHVIIRDILPMDLVNRLIVEFPSGELILDRKPPGDNKRFDYIIEQVRKQGGVSELWHEFVEAQVSDDFWNDFLRLFGDEVRRRYPELEIILGDLAKARRGIRYVDEYDQADVLQDCHISINTPCLSGGTQVRSAHVDDPKKLYAGLLYLRPDDDDSTGADLLLYKYKNGVRPKFFGQQIKEKYLESVDKVEYKKNIFIFFLNSLDSLHGVTARAVTPHTRKFVNLVAEVREPIFDIKSVQENIWIRRLRAYTGWRKGFENR